MWTPRQKPGTFCTPSPAQGGARHGGDTQDGGGWGTPRAVARAPWRRWVCRFEAQRRWERPGQRGRARERPAATPSLAHRREGTGPAAQREGSTRTAFGPVAGALAASVAYSTIQIPLRHVPSDSIPTTRRGVEGVSVIVSTLSERTGTRRGMDRRPR